MRRYRELLADLSLARAAAGGSLCADEELRRLAELDAVWSALPEDEQNAVDEGLVAGVELCPEGDFTAPSLEPS
jgi:hypothetical protein